MKAYQKLWIKELRDEKLNTKLYDICRDIISDDTGGTDELSQVLAKEILNLLTTLRGME